ncbi:ATP-binding protein [Desulfonema magnum]|uniref:ATP-binding protein n=1 Tax=Desulfonema magnum TaxID=45655 RepID=UPI001A9B1790|nr:ATP-binding protein [Desulfonema magnum]
MRFEIRSPITKFQVSNFKFRVSNFKFRVSSFEFQISSFEFQVSSFKFRVSSSEFQVSSFKFQVSSFEFQVSSFEFQVSSFKFQVSSFKFRVSNMTKFFNTTGPCRPEIHYMADPLSRLPMVRELIEDQHYFVLHGPRRTGKTTYLYALMNQLSQEGKYSALTVNIQPAASVQNPTRAMIMVADAICNKARRHLPEKEWPEPVENLDQDMLARGQLQRYLNLWAEKNPKPVVLFIDEADSLPDELFLALLRQLRAGFEDRPHGFPHSVALAGLRLGINALLNIKTPSLLLDAFTLSETDALLNQHTAETGQIFTREAINEIFRLTRGQPWLTNTLVRETITEILKNDFTKEITPAHVARARKALVRERKTHLDNLIGKLKESPVKNVTEALISGEFLQSDRLEDLTYLQDFGLVTRELPIKFANPIYTEIIPEALSYCWKVSFSQELVYEKKYIKNGLLDIDSLISAFQEFYRHHSEIWLERFEFCEIGRQLLFIAFLQRIVGTEAMFEYEMELGSRHLSLLLEFASERFAMELKLQRNRYSEDEGLKEIVRYLNRIGMDQGYLILFETNSQIPWEECTYRLDSQIPWEKRIYRKEITHEGKKIIFVGM